MQIKQTLTFLSIVMEEISPFLTTECHPRSKCSNWWYIEWEKKPILRINYLPTYWMQISVLQGNLKPDDKTIQEYQMIKSNHRYHVLHTIHSQSCYEWRLSEAGGRGGGSSTVPWSKEGYRLMWHKMLPKMWAYRKLFCFLRVKLCINV